MLSPTSKMEEQSSFVVVTQSQPLRSFFLAQSTLRALAAACTLASLCVMVTSKESVLVFEIHLEARYNYASACRYLMGVNSIVFGFSLLSLAFLCRLQWSKPNSKHYFFLFLHDLVITALMMSGCSAASAIGYVGRYGEERIGWFSVCEHVAKFCSRMLVALILSSLAFFCYFTLSIASARKLSLLPGN
ncbi:hypothetical protein SAY87_022999 [Trapa incisa]|uniref:CASP-like protein n=1 Tax=Trapa incisa TaxID=236973 RepID=A0AAN7K1S8_9MYRT|nr:hypothetical protein SAY87_022999 [Trapa incisa]